MAIPAITPILIPEVALSHESVVDADHPTIEVKAICGGSEVSGRLTLGSIDTPQANYDLAAAQADVDAFKQKLSDQASFREKMRSIVAQLK